MDIIKEYKDYFTGKINKYFSPGRVNIIGEHIDYHGGNVFPFAINLGTYGYVSKRQDKKFRMYSLGFKDKGIIIRNIEDLNYKVEDDWANYLKGIIKEIVILGYKIPFGLDILISSDLPNGAGLSSSASIELLMGVILNEEFKLNIDKITLIKIAKKVENEYIGVNCGVMDQFAVMMSKKNNAMLLNTQNLSYKYAKLNLDKYSFVIVNTMKRRSLSASKYNERKEECEKGLKIIKQNGYKINNLCELNSVDLKKIKNFVLEDKIYRRIKHVITENERTLLSFEALKRNDFKKLGELMNESHKSLKNDYEVSSYELDILQEALIKNKALGSRMTGAGFGGCTVSLISKESLNEIIKLVKESYYLKTKIIPEFYIVQPSIGTTQISE